MSFKGIDAVTLSSVISISLVPSFERTCSTSITFAGSFGVDCDGTILAGTGLNYATFNEQWMKGFGAPIVHKGRVKTNMGCSGWNYSELGRGTIVGTRSG